MPLHTPPRPRAAIGSEPSARGPLLTVGPLARGLGHTLGPALCRALCDTTASRPRSDCAWHAVLPGPRAGLERLAIAIDADGTPAAAAALRAAARLLGEQVHGLAGAWSGAGAPPAPGTPDPLLLQPIEVLGLGVRSANALQAAGLRLLGDLVPRSAAELLRLPTLGRRGLAEVQQSLASLGLLLGTPVR